MNDDSFDARQAELARLRLTRPGRRIVLTGLDHWTPGEGSPIHFGIDRTQWLNRPLSKPRARWRTWLGLKLYAVVYWLLGGRA